MIETKEQYEEIINTMPAQAIGKAMYLTATIEALREVAREGFWVIREKPTDFGPLQKALDALSDWITDES